MLPCAGGQLEAVRGCVGMDAACSGKALALRCPGASGGGIFRRFLQNSKTYRKFKNFSDFRISPETLQNYQKLPENLDWGGPVKFSGNFQTGEAQSNFPVIFH